MKWLKIMAAAGLGLYALSFYLFPSYSHRYKTTVEIEVDGKIYRGSGITDVTFHMNGPMAPLAQNTLYYDITSGRAAVVDLKEHGVVLALIKPGAVALMTWYQPPPEYAKYIALKAYYGEIRRSTVQDQFRTISGERGPRIAEPDNYPAFVWLSDPKDQKSAVPLQPNDMGRTIGTLVQLRSVTIEITGESPSNDVFEKLPWLAAAREREKKSHIFDDPNNYRLKAVHVLGEM